jgi:hypothetical protein
MFILQHSPSLLFLGLSCVRIQNVIPWIQKLQPELQEIRFYVSTFAWKSSLTHICDTNISTSFHDIPMTITSKDRELLVGKIIEELKASNTYIVCIIQDPLP